MGLSPCSATDFTRAHHFPSVFFSHHFFSRFAIIKQKMVLLSFLLVRMMAFNIERFHEPWECRPCNNIGFFHCHMSNYNKLSIFHRFMLHAQGRQTLDLPRLVWEDKKDLSDVWKFPVMTAGQKKRSFAFPPSWKWMEELIGEAMQRQFRLMAMPFSVCMASW